MAVLNGQIAAIGIGGMEKANRNGFSAGLWGYDPVDYLNLAKGQASATTMHQQRIIHYPSVSPLSLSGKLTQSYFDEYYNRIHIIPNPIVLGNVLSSETREVYVWNAFFSAQALNSITKESAEGLEIIGPTSYNFAPLEEVIYWAAISIQGPPSINATITFNFTVYPIPLIIRGERVVLWRWIPQSDYTEELKWLTNVLQTRQGEQRIALRDAPRQVFNYEFFHSPRETAQVKTVAGQWSHRIWGLPIWKEANSGVSAASGSVFIAIDTANRDFRAGELAVIWESTDKAEAVHVTNVRADGIDIDPGLALGYTDALVMPLRKAITPDGVHFSRGKTGEWTRFSVAFIVADNIDLAETRIVGAWEPGMAVVKDKLYSPSNDYVYIVNNAGTGIAGEVSQWPKTIGDTVTDTNGVIYKCASSGYPQYLTYDVLTDGNIVIGDLSEHIHHPLVQIDNGQGPITIETTQDYSRFMRTIGKYTNSLSALWTWRKWLHSRYGRQKAFWLPSWNKDLQLITTILSTETTATIEHINISLFGDFPLSARLALTNGLVMYRQITVAEELPDGNERITFDKSFGRDIQPADIDRWCFMDLVRFDSDSIGLAHKNPYFMETNIPVVRVPA